MNRLPYNPKTLEPTDVGVFDVDEVTYHKIKALNYSSLKILKDRSPRHLKVVLDGDDMREVTPQLQAKFNFGTAVDLGLFEPGRFEEEVVRAINAHKNSKAYKEWAEQQAGRVILDDKAYKRATMARDEVGKKQVASDLLKMGWAQKTVFWRHPDFGFWCKARPDWIVAAGFEPVVMDLKTTEDASAWKFRRVIWRLKYYWQAAWYLQGLTIATGMPHKTWYWLAVETWPPFESNVFKADRSEIERSENDIWVVCQKYAECLETGVWPGYEDKVVELGFDDDDYEPTDIEDDIPY